MERFGICISLGILAGLAAVCTAAVPPLPCEMYGNVTLGGEPAPAGTVIEARIGEAVHGSVVTGTPGRYGGMDTFDERLVVQAPAELIGRTVSFVVGTDPAAETAVYTPGAVIRLDLTAGASAVRPLPGMEAPPGDPDGDGLCEDLNANGRADFDDVVRYYAAMGWIIENEPASAFDFNGNGRIDFDDLVLLYHRV
jgi:PKD repeat protein